jgi:hypothetical protein
MGSHQVPQTVYGTDNIPAFQSVAHINPLNWLCVPTLEQAAFDRSPVIDLTCSCRSLEKTTALAGATILYFDNISIGRINPPLNIVKGRFPFADGEQHGGRQVTAHHQVFVRTMQSRAALDATGAAPAACLLFDIRTRCGNTGLVRHGK